MKFGVSSYSFDAYRGASGCNYLDICDLTKEMGFDGIDFTALNPQVAGVATEEEAAKQIRERCDKLGLEVFSHTVGANFFGDKSMDEVEEMLCHKLDIAKILGAPVLRHDVAYNLPAGANWEDGIAMMAPSIRRITEYGESLGIRTCTENHGYIYQAPERVLALIKAVDHKNYGWLFDMGNFVCADADPVAALHIAMPYIFHVHAKDMIIKPCNALRPGGFGPGTGVQTFRGTILGHGQTPVVEILLGLHRWGYDGTVSLEFEGFEDCLTAIRWGHDYMRGVEKMFE